MTQAETLTGPGHFRTGSAGSLHITVRALEGYRDAAGQDDEVVKRYAVAMRRAARQVEEIELELVGLTLTSGTVMVCASPVDDNAELVRFRYEDSAHGRRMRPEVLASVRAGRPQPMSAGRP
ncbi:MAG: hypothetical protein IMZ75_10675 [Actinobacteria bacterium]|nr:hypothetical protein [Actinomycetota bacterium]